MSRESPVSDNPMTLEEFLDHVASVVSDYFEDYPDELSAEVRVPTQFAVDQREEFEQLLGWLVDDLKEAGIEEECQVEYDARYRLIVVTREN